MTFGEHLTIDGYGGKKELLSDKALILKCLDELPTQLGMKKLSNPEIYLANGNGIKDPGGWSGFVVIQESHISIHTFPDKNFVSADVYTCKNGLNVGMITEYFKHEFRLSDVETNLIKRGTRYPG